MTEANQQLDETDKSTLDETREAEESSELDDLFSEEESSDDAPVTREEYNRLLKGVKKLASEQGRTKAVKVETQEVKKVAPSDDLSELFFAQIPQAELVQGDLKNVADKLYDGSILKAWKNEKWIQDKAKALADEKAEDEANRGKIDRPSQGGSGKSKIPFSQIDLENKDHVALLRSNPKYRDEYNAFLLKQK